MSYDDIWSFIDSERVRMSDNTDNMFSSTDSVETVELRPDVFVYREREGAQQYVCKHCLDAGVKSLLSREESVASVRLVCNRCGSAVVERKKPLSGLAMSPWG